MASTQQRRRSSGQGPVKRGGARNKKEDKEMKEPPELTSEQLEAIYTNKEYEPPAPGALEAIFEKEAAVKRRGATEELVLGKNLSRRVMKFPEYWVEDKAKTRHRAKMTAKAHKGRQKFHLVALTDQEKEKLDNLILESEDLSGSDGENVYPEPPPQGEASASKASHKRTPKSSPKTPATVTASPLVQLSTPVGGSPKLVKKNRRRSSLFKTLTKGQHLQKPQGEEGRLQEKQQATPKEQFSPLPPPSGTDSAMEEEDFCDHYSPFPSPPPMEAVVTPAAPESSEENSRVAGAGETGSLTPVIEGATPARDDELRRQIEEADSLFGVVAGDLPGNRRKGPDETSGPGCRRKSALVRVRRSTRIMAAAAGRGLEKTPEAPATSGSTYQVAEVLLSKRRRRSIMGLHMQENASNGEDVTEEPDGQDLC